MSTEAPVIVPEQTREPEDLNVTTVALPLTDWEPPVAVNGVASTA